MKQKDILLLLIPMFIIVMVWIAFSIYHNSASSTISQTLNVTIKSIKPDFDTQTIEALKKREQITPLFGSKAQETPTPTPPPSTPEQGGNPQ